ncbi:MAG: STAS domain-containing protein [Deltaproteobacteria bacterium]|nr:STAS domain-containing protein [Deltaproteobacteria bacterium]
MSYLNVRTRQADGALVVYIDGYLNSLLGEEVERVVQETLDSGMRNFLLNFEGTRLINSIGISIIIDIVEKIMERNGMLAFCALSRINRELFQMTGVARYVRVFEREEEALGYFGTSA